MCATQVGCVHDWCDGCLLELNLSKTKEIMIAPKHIDIAPTTINGANLEIVQNYKYLGTVFDDKLRFTDVVKKAHQRLYCLRKLNSFGVDQRILSTFYSSFIESILTFSFGCWFKSLCQRHKNRLQGVEL